jgi:hypothetical protein
VQEGRSMPVVIVQPTGQAGGHASGRGNRSTRGAGPPAAGPGQQVSSAGWDEASTSFSVRGAEGRTGSSRAS